MHWCSGFFRRQLRTGCQAQSASSGESSESLAKTKLSPADPEQSSPGQSPPRPLVEDADVREE
eukprot:12998223-Alexandrium_andersonii.AAC.1